MRDTTLRDHLTIVAQLPDFVLGKLDETSLRRVSPASGSLRHLPPRAGQRDGRPWHARRRAATPGVGA